LLLIANSADKNNKPMVFALIRCFILFSYRNA
jgi:hypothetical protein